MAEDRLGMEEESEIIYIADDEGNEEEFEVIMKFEVDGSEAKYMMVAPVEPEDGETDVYAFRYEEDGDDIKLFVIQDDAEWDIVEETFNTF